MAHKPYRRSRAITRSPLMMESLEVRQLLSVAVATFATSILDIPQPIARDITPFGTAAPEGYSPTVIADAYGVNQITFGTAAVQGTGAGTTIAIVDAYDDPTIKTDLAAFDSYFNLPAPPSFQVVGQTGSTTNLPGVDPVPPGGMNWEGEEALDVEWAHALAPGANIILVEATSDQSLYTAVQYAATIQSVDVISISWGGTEFAGETTNDSVFTTPVNHTPITFVVASGDIGAPGSYPAYSPNVVAVGGTSLTASGSGVWEGETGWGDAEGASGGGISLYEPQPAFQSGVVTQSTTQRTIPDVSMNADPETGVPVYDSYNNANTTGPWEEVGGTSLAAPSFAALLSIADQGRILAGEITLSSGNSLSLLYSANATDFHDITVGNNSFNSNPPDGFSAGPGYDLVTGRGSPISNLLIPYLVAANTTVPSANVPYISSITATPNPDPSAGNLTLTAHGIHLPTPGNYTLTFYLETNSVDGLQTASIGGDFAFAPITNGTTSLTIPATGFDGTYIFYAALVDSTGTPSPTGTLAPAVSVQIGSAVTGGPVIGSLTATPNPATVGGNVTLTANNITDTDGGTVNQIAFYEETNDIAGLQVGFLGDLAFSSTSSSNSFTISNIAAAGAFTFYAVATDDQGQTSPIGTAAPSVTVTVTAPVIPVDPTNLVVTPVSSSEIDLHWAELSNSETSFQIERSLDSSFTSPTILTTLTNRYTFTFQDTGLTPDTVYYYRVAAVNSAGTSGYSNTATTTTLDASAGGAAPRPLDDAYVTKVFTDILDRTPDQGTIDGFAGQIDNGVTPAAFAMQILTSAEYDDDVIRAAYTQILGTTPDDATINAFSASLQAGASDEAVIDNFYGSPAFYANAGGTNADYVAALFQSALGRAVDTPTLNADVAALDSNAITTTQLAFDVLISPEHANVEVSSLYTTYLHRAADAGGKLFFAQQLVNGASDESVAAQLIASPEYFINRVGATGTLNQAFVEQAFATLLGRPADPTGLTYFTNILDTLSNTVGRQQVIKGITASPEYKAILIQGDYQEYLGRPATTAEVNLWTAYLGDNSDLNLVAQIVGSSEYYADQGGTNADFLNGAYIDLLNQLPSTSSSQYLSYLTGLNNQTSSTASIARLFTNTSTFRDNIVTTLYETLLARQPDAAGLAFYAGEVNTISTEGVIAQLAASPEFFHTL